ncbi:uncharacterized protein LOC123532676 [Mercenaria mercenaria]|uniref:uncharacterized protein LOC123532676 n=1 Tax=Mercenaria mercenaria TaxID=6596 RepID=UPI00234F28E3|nr:uncharacterized protein LOC123532676 [Mercenaria mercenaria]
MFSIFSFVSVCCFLVNADDGLNSDTKRLVLHSELDLAHEVATLRQELKQYKDEIQNLTSRLNEKDTQIAKLEAASGSGSSYVRWGRTTCPGNGTDIVYSGYMGTASNDFKVGTGSNYLCLSEKPQWDHYEDSIESLGKIAGVEYQFVNHRGNGASNFFGYNVYNDNAPCAVCHTRRSSSIMIPGRMDCYSGWTKEYNGYLVSGWVGQSHDSEFICLDRRPETVVGGKTDDDEARLFFVEAVCGKSLECPPYIHGRELTCVVCSK